MQQCFYVNVPLDGNIFKKTKKQQKKSAHGNSQQHNLNVNPKFQTVEPSVWSPPRKRCENREETKNTTEKAG